MPSKMRTLASKQFKGTTSIRPSIKADTGHRDSVVTSVRLRILKEMNANVKYNFDFIDDDLLFSVGNKKRDIFDTISQHSSGDELLSLGSFHEQEYNTDSFQGSDDEDLSKARRKSSTTRQERAQRRRLDADTVVAVSNYEISNSDPDQQQERRLRPRKHKERAVARNRSFRNLRSSSQIFALKEEMKDDVNDEDYAPAFTSRKKGRRIAISESEEDDSSSLSLVSLTELESD